MSTPHKFDSLAGKRTISLTTFYKSGKPVSTPVEFVRDDDKLYVSTEKSSYKVKRLRNNPKAEIASCTMRGKITGSKIDVQVKIISQEDGKFAQEKLDVLYQGLIYRIMHKIMFWRSKEEVVYLEIT
ncbi:MAG: PPOX class F420-dependent oxidoreductase [Candidatus Hodarchaeales archaeon]